MKVEYTPREVIENKLLAALDDEGKVAIVATEADLTLLIYGMYLVELDGQNKTEAVRMANDLRKLKSAAFPGR